jgi:hypothetical protein
MEVYDFIFASLFYAVYDIFDVFEEKTFASCYLLSDIRIVCCDFYSDFPSNRTFYIT